MAVETTAVAAEMVAATPIGPGLHLLITVAELCVPDLDQMPHNCITSGRTNVITYY